MTRSIAWDKVTRDDVLHAIQEYDLLRPERFFAAHGFAPTTTYDLVWDERNYPPKAMLGRPGPSRFSKSLDSPSSRDDQPPVD
jgi:hypothetical protein